MVRQYQIGRINFRYVALFICCNVVIHCARLILARNFLKVRVLKRIKRVILSIAPVAIVFLIWDAYAIAKKHWYFDPNQTLGIKLPFDIPLEELLFFVIVPLAAILTIEAVRSVKTHWEVGDK